MFRNVSYYCIRSFTYKITTLHKIRNPMLAFSNHSIEILTQNLIQIVSHFLIHDLRRSISRLEERD